MFICRFRFVGGGQRMATGQSSDTVNRPVLAVCVDTSPARRRQTSECGERRQACRAQAEEALVRRHHAHRDGACKGIFISTNAFY